MRSREAVWRVGAEAFGKRFSMIFVALSLRKRAQAGALALVCSEKRATDDFVIKNPKSFAVVYLSDITDLAPL